MVYRYSCLAAGHTLRLTTSSEAHHIKPLGNPYKGPDIAENILVLCPNHHAILDYKGMTLDLTELRLEPLHQVAPEYVDFHNTVIIRE